MQKIEDVFQPNLACTDSNLEKMLLHVFSTLSEELLTCIYTCGSSTDPWGGGQDTKSGNIPYWENYWSQACYVNYIMINNKWMEHCTTIQKF